MFSGIIEKLGRIKTVSRTGQSLTVVVETGFEGLELGESVAVNGVCLTVSEYSAGGAATFFVSSETIKRSNLGPLVAGNLVNLERAVRPATRLSGHLVQGHVDGKAILSSLTPDAEAFRLRFSLPGALGRYCVEKGSIALNGVSLTLNSVEQQPGENSLIGITVIPHTWDHTNLHTVEIGAAVNVEIDLIAKYVESLCQPYQKP